MGLFDNFRSNMYLQCIYQVLFHFYKKKFQLLPFTLSFLIFPFPFSGTGTGRIQFSFRISRREISSWKFVLNSGKTENFLKWFVCMFVCLSVCLSASYFLSFFLSICRLLSIFLSFLHSFFFSSRISRIMQNFFIFLVPKIRDENGNFI